MEHRRAEHMPGGKGGEPKAVPFERRAEIHFARSPRAEAVAVEASGGGSAKGQLMGRHVVHMRMRDKPSRLPPANIDREIEMGDFQPAVEVEHGTDIGGFSLEYRLEAEGKPAKAGTPTLAQLL